MTRKMALLTQQIRSVGHTYPRLNSMAAKQLLLPDQVAEMYMPRAGEALSVVIALSWGPESQASSPAPLPHQQQ